MDDPLILYSTTTWLAYKIAQKYYGRVHYVWCTPHFDPRQSGDRDADVPPTSSPLEIYRSLANEVERGDRHSAKIKENRTGILHGANVKKSAGVINDDQEREIVSIVNLAECRDFRPLMYVIPHALVGDRIKEPPPEDKAHPLSAEFIIDALPRPLFDIIDFGGIK